MSQYKFIGASIGNCNRVLGCEMAPDIVKTNLQLEALWHKTIKASTEKTKLEAIDELNKFSIALAKETTLVLKSGHKFINIGGDHSSGIGTWSGVHDAVGEFGLIWVDAHMDAHTPESSPSKNLHGTPVASLLGFGDKKLTSILSENPKIKPENVTLIGIRSYEEPEERLLTQLGVKVYKMKDIEENSFQELMDLTINKYLKKGLKFGISFDLDVLDPKDISAFATPVKDGLKLHEAIQYFKKMDTSNLLGLEIVEFNPKLDLMENGVEVIGEIIESIEIKK
jgi:arginase